MDWPDERYVRVYTRDTINWKLFPWQAKCVLTLVMRKMERAGIIELSGAGLEGLAALIDIPLEVVDPGIQALLAKGTLVLAGDTLVMPNFIEAQECRQSDVQRQRESRDRRRTDQLRVMTPTLSPAVTNGHQPSPIVTPAVPSPPSRAEPAVPAVPEEEAGAFQDLWNQDAHPALPRWNEMSAGREKKAKARLKEKPLAVWAEVIARINASAFLRGETERGWKAGPDWLLKPDTATKVLEGQYDDHRGPAPPRDARRRDPLRRPPGDPCVDCGGYTEVKFGEDWRCYPCGAAWEDSDVGRAMLARWREELNAHLREDFPETDQTEAREGA